MWGRRKGNSGLVNFSSSDVTKDEDEEEDKEEEEDEREVEDEEGMKGLLSSCNGGDVLPLLLSSDQEEEEDANGK